MAKATKPIAMPSDVYVDDIIGGCPTVRVELPGQEPITFRLSADAARVLALALQASWDISQTTGWGKGRPKLEVKPRRHFYDGKWYEPSPPSPPSPEDS